jgi:predicted enzyme related to lactoylglutathione lyase
MKTHIVLPWLLVLGFSLEHAKSCCCNNGNQLNATRPSVLLEVEDVKQVHQEWLAKGIHFTKVPYKITTGWAAELQDASGNIIGITDHKKD